jgi:hypothetical protein
MVHSMKLRRSIPSRSFGQIGATNPETDDGGASPNSLAEAGPFRDLTEDHYQRGWVNAHTKKPAPAAIVTVITSSSMSASASGSARRK